MASTYPDILDTFLTNRDNNTPMFNNHKQDHDDLADAVNKIEAALGVLPFGIFSTVAAAIAILSQLNMNGQSGTAYTLELTDQLGLVSMNNSSPNVITIPTNTSVAFPIGISILIRQAGTGQTEISPDSGVTLNARGGAYKLAGQYAYATLIKIATDSWELTGDVTV